MNAVAIRRTARHSEPVTLLLDCTFLCVVVWLSLVLYVGDLGLYSDDWAFLRTLYGVDNPTFLRLFGALQAELATRPVQGMLLAGLYRWFGLDPLGYHLVNGAVLCGAVGLFYVALRALGVSRMLSLAVPLIFALLPHYSTDRFWIAAFQANISVCLYFFSLYAGLRAVRTRGSVSPAWTIIMSVSVLGTVLAYEVVAPLFLLNVLVIVHHARKRNQDDRTGRGTWKVPLLIAGLHVMVLMLSVAYKLTTTDRAGGLGEIGTYIWNIKRTVRGAIGVNFGSYGLGLPQKIVVVSVEYADAAVIGLGCVLGLIVFGYLYRVVGQTSLTAATWRQWLAMAAIGLAAFGLGYAISLVTFDIGFSATGINNRTAIGAAVGVALVFVAGIGLVTSILPERRQRHGVFCAGVALLCASGFLVVNTIADFWVSAAHRQHDVIESIRPLHIAPGSVLLLDGFCSYVGPGVVFETNWDVSGMLQILVDPSLEGDVVKSNTEVRQEGVRTQLYDDVIHTYPFDDDLLAYHVARRQLYRLSTLDRARGYFDEVHSTTDLGCPDAKEGAGASIF